MFSRDWWINQGWRVIIGAAVCVVLMVVYYLLQLVHVWIVVTTLTYATNWFARAFLLVVGLWVLGCFVNYMFASDD
ncbi:MAG: hypothetical protein WAX38_02140 [Minisyncoccia bacterium]